MKNPWLSMWLSGANAWSGAARGMMTAEMRRNQNAMMQEVAKQATALWFPHLSAGNTDQTKTSTKRKPRRG